MTEDKWYRRIVATNIPLDREVICILAPITIATVKYFASTKVHPLFKMGCSMSLEKHDLMFPAILTISKTFPTHKIFIEWFLLDCAVEIGMLRGRKKIDEKLFIPTHYNKKFNKCLKPKLDILLALAANPTNKVVIRAARSKLKNIRWAWQQNAHTLGHVNIP